MRLRTIGSSRMWIVLATSAIIALGVLTGASAAPAYSILHTFNAYADGKYPNAPLLLASDGNFYGTTVEGGTDNLGTVFQLSSTGTIKTIHSFAGVADGTQPGGPLAEGPDGYLYGTTPFGPDNGGGSIFKVSKDGSSFINMYTFTTEGGSGYEPASCLAIDAAGNIYGATSAGTSNGDGTIFSIPFNDNSVTVL